MLSAVAERGAVVAAGASRADVDRVQDDIEMRATRKPREEAAKLLDGLVPLGWHTTPEEIAHAVVYLAADESAMMTSHTFAIDGGLSG
jgi:NAD(P)-dependent dehydrogenase (short-subunit alcohol dehydrogenase family)